MELSRENVYSLLLRSFHCSCYITASSVAANSDARWNRQQKLDWGQLCGNSGDTQPSPVFAVLIFELRVARFAGFSYEIRLLNIGRKMITKKKNPTLLDGLQASRNSELHDSH